MQSGKMSYLWYTNTHGEPIPLSVWGCYASLWMTQAHRPLCSGDPHSGGSISWENRLSRHLLMLYGWVLSSLVTRKVFRKWGKLCYDLLMSPTSAKCRLIFPYVITRKTSRGCSDPLISQKTAVCFLSFHLMRKFVQKVRLLKARLILIACFGISRSVSLFYCLICWRKWVLWAQPRHCFSYLLGRFHLGIHCLTLVTWHLQLQ